MKRSEECKGVAVIATAVVVVGLSVAGCGSKSQEKSAQVASTQTSATDSTSTATGTTSGVEATGQSKDVSADATKSGAKPIVAANKSKGIIAVPPGKKADIGLQQITEAQSKVDLDKMPDNLVICTVGGAPITIGDYRRERHVQLEQIRSQLSVDGGLMQELLGDARAKHLVLTADEKHKLIETTHKAKTATAGVLDKLLKEQHMTADQFDAHILELGLAMKAATDNVDHNLLGELVDRELLCAASTTNGFAPQAFNKYVEIKKSPQYQYMLKSGLMSPDQLKDETVKSELMGLEVEKIQDANPVTDKQISDFYNKNKNRFKHGERIRLSQIVIACPKQDGPTGESVRTQIKKKNPNITPAELDAQTKITEQQAANRAQELLARALKGEDFAQLANQNTEDMEARAAKNGGDLGYQSKDQLQNDFSDKIWAMKPGQVCPTVFPTGLGLFIFKVTDKQPAGTFSLAEVKDVLKQALAQQNQAVALSNWITERRKAVPIEISAKFLSIASANTKTGGTTQ